MVTLTLEPPKGSSTKSDFFTWSVFPFVLQIIVDIHAHV
jgi:hypothetical protein